MTSPAKPRAVKRLLPSVPNGNSLRPPAGNRRDKLVTFKSEIIETSFGGTQSIGQIPHNSSTSTCGSSPLATSLQESRDSIDSVTPTTTTQSIASEVSYSIEHTGGGKTSTPTEEMITINSTASFSDSAAIYDTPNRRSTFSSNVTIKLSPDVHNTAPRRHTMENCSPLGTPSSFYSPNVSLTDSVAEWNTPSLSEEDNCSLTVAVRVRPFSSRELLDQNLHNVVNMDGNETTVTTDSGNVHKFAYDFSFWSVDNDTTQFASQNHVYNCLAQPLLAKAFDGYNTCLFAYGQTGSGKSYSMMGHTSELGVIPRFCEELFARIDQNARFDNVKTNVEISYIEIYNEKLHNLLATSKTNCSKKALRVREHPILGPYVEGLPTFVVNSYQDVQGWLTLGNKNRATACTGMNDKSSRSHSVFTIVMTQAKKEYLEGKEHDHSITSKINLVDLAGSERQSLAHTTGERFREGTNINKSLLTLGKVISLLAEQSTNSRKRKKVFICYRDSVLTWLLKESLGGNSKTAMLANISPAHLHIEETLSTLRYASQARSIVNVVRINEDPKARLIRDLRAEIDKLRQQTFPELNHAASLAEIASLNERLEDKEKQMADMTKSWLEKLAQSEARKMEELTILEKAGVSFKVDNKLPNLVNLNEDPQLSEMLLYVIKEGSTRVGRMRPTSTHDIQLNGALIADDHCILKNNQGVVEVTPQGDAPTYINGILVTGTTILHHGDRVVLGGDHYFRVNHPIEVAVNKRTNPTAKSEIKDFEFARNELSAAQEARVKEEREAARRQAQDEMMLELNQCRHGYENKLAQLEHTLKSKDSEMMDAEGQIHRLRKQKMILEHEVLAGRQKQKSEFIASEKIAVESRVEHSKLLQLLEDEKEKMSEKLRVLRERRTSIVEGGVTGIYSRHLSTNVTYKLTLQLREANKISQYLHRNTTFTQEMTSKGDESVVRVSNTKYGVSTTWTIQHFLLKLDQMRELYQGESDSQNDDVFYNHTDQWQQDDHFPFSPLSTPRLSTSILGNSPLMVRPTPPPMMSTPDNYERVDTSSMVVVRLCKDLINSSLDSLNQDSLTRETLADKTVYVANSIKNEILAILDILPESFQNLAGQISDDCSLAQHSCVRIVSHFQLLVHISSLWASTYLPLEATLITEQTNEIARLVQVVGTQLTFFYQGCENEVSSMVEDSAATIFDSLFLICNACGELSLATDTDVTSLQNTSFYVQPHVAGHDIRQYYLCGCATYVDKTMQGGIQRLEDCETKIHDLLGQTVHTSAKTSLLAQNIQVIVSTSKILLHKCQQLQEEIDTSLQENTESRSGGFYASSYMHSQGVISHVTTLVDSVTMISQLMSSAMSGDSPNSEQFTSCADFINESISKLVLLHQDTQDTDLDLSVISTSQFDQLESIAQEVITATSRLITSVNKDTGNSHVDRNRNLGKLTVRNRLLSLSPR